MDGFIARKLGCVSKTGALLDSIADFVWIVVLFFIFVPYFHWPVWTVVWVSLIMLLRFTTLIIGYTKYKTLAFLHTYANKATGLTLFCFPFLYVSIGFENTAIILCALSSISAIEEFTITLISKRLVRDIPSIFHIDKKELTDT